MTRRRGIRTCLLVVIILALVGGPTFADGPVQLHETGATAFFSRVDGCISTSVFVIARAAAGSFAPSEPTRSVSVVVSQFDLCDVMAILTGNGAAEDANITVTPNLDSASVSAVVPVLNGANGQLVHVSVNLQFTATSPTTSDTGQEIDPDSPGSITIFRGNSRAAIATGSITTERGALVGDLVEAEIHDIRVVDR